MYCSLKLILIVIFFYCRHSSSLEASDNKAKINMILTSCIGGGILVVLLVLLGVVLCLYLRMAKALKVPKPPVCLALKNNPSIFARNKITAVTPLTAGCYPGLRCYPTLQCYEDCDLYADSEPLTPCFCDVNEGL